MWIVCSDIRAILQKAGNLTRVFPAFYQNLIRCFGFSGRVVCAHVEYTTWTGEDPSRRSSWAGRKKVSAFPGIFPQVNPIDI